MTRAERIAYLGLALCLILVGVVERASLPI